MCLHNTINSHRFLYLLPVCLWWTDGAHPVLYFLYEPRQRLKPSCFPHKYSLAHSFIEFSILISISLFRSICGHRDAQSHFLCFLSSFEVNEFLRNTRSTSPCVVWHKVSQFNNQWFTCLYGKPMWIMMLYELILVVQFRAQLFFNECWCTSDWSQLCMLNINSLCWNTYT